MVLANLDITFLELVNNNNRQVLRHSSSVGFLYILGDGTFVINNSRQDACFGIVAHSDFLYIFEECSS